MDSDAAELTIENFERAAIDPEQFNHEAHIYMAWAYLDRYPVAEAIGRFTDALKRLTAELGVPGKYHETITWFYLLLIAERRGAEQSWAEFRAANPDLFDHSDNVLARYYRSATLASERARRSFVLPDTVAA